MTEQERDERLVELRERLTRKRDYRHSSWDLGHQSREQLRRVIAEIEEAIAYWRGRAVDE